MLMAGSAYETLGYPGVWSLNESYYEACILTAPHTKIAESCFDRYSHSIYLGYTGSAGLSVPENVNRHLIQLRKTAHRK